MSEPIDPLDKLLREQNPYVDDNGFTARVIKDLPRRRRSWLRPTILFAAIAAGSVMAVRWLPWNELPSLDSSLLTASGLQQLSPWILVAVVIGSLIWTLALALQED